MYRTHSQITRLTILLVPTVAAVDFSTLPGFRDVSITQSAGGKAICASANVTTSVTATNQKYSVEPPANQFELTEIIQEAVQVNSTFVADHTLDTTTFSADFQISANLCLPSDPNKAAQVKTLQILSHGTSVTKAYWDIAPGFSYVDAATDAGFATFAYDRLGSGQSEHPDPINQVQVAAQVEVLHSLITTLKGVHLGTQTFQNIACVGHSYGSIIQLAHDQKYPEDCSAVIPTGIGPGIQNTPLSVAAIEPAIASVQDPSKFGGLSTAYLLVSSAMGNQFDFYRFPNFDPQVFETQFDETTTFSVGELLSIAILFSPASNYTGPVDTVLAQFDVPFCGGNCLVPTDQAAAFSQVFYPSAQGSSLIVPEIGHLINCHFNTSMPYDQMLQFLNSHGL